MPILSILVPIYKVEPYIRQCIDSILCQSFTDFELILVDDGSPDNCPAICEEYAQKDVRVKVIHQKNQGLAAARRTGLSVAKGKWILFCDSDDYYLGDSLSSFLKAIDLSRTDTLYCFDFFNVWPDHVERTRHYSPQVLQFPSLEENIEFIASAHSHRAIGYAVWDKLYSKALIDQLSIHPLCRDDMKHKDDWAEDLAFNLQYLMAVKRIVVADYAVYGLRKHGNVEEQNECGLVSRLDHMMDIFLEETKTAAYLQSEEVSEEFWKILIWHLKRYLYLDVAAKGIESLDCLKEKPYYSELKACILQVQKNWKSYKSRWSPTDASDYKYLLQYIVDGNLLKYKIKNYWLWKIQTGRHKCGEKK